MTIVCYCAITTLIIAKPKLCTLRLCLAKNLEIKAQNDILDFSSEDAKWQ